MHEARVRRDEKQGGAGLTCQFPDVNDLWRERNDQPTRIGINTLSEQSMENDASVCVPRNNPIIQLITLGSVGDSTNAGSKRQEVNKYECCTIRTPRKIVFRLEKYVYASREPHIRLFFVDLAFALPRGCDGSAPHRK